jgi:hypothetical protein
MVVGKPMTQIKPPIRVARHRSVIMGGRYNKRDGFPQRIDDVYPSVPERLYRIEGDVERVQQEFRDHREESIRAVAGYATKEHLTDLEKVFRESLQAINKRMDRRTAFVVLQTVALIISAAYGLILSYKHFISP